jgi:hypothetical protein
VSAPAPKSTRPVSPVLRPLRCRVGDRPAHGAHLWRRRHAPRSTVRNGRPPLGQEMQKRPAKAVSLLPRTSSATTARRWTNFSSRRLRKSGSTGAPCSALAAPCVRFIHLDREVRRSPIGRARRALSRRRRTAPQPIPKRQPNPPNGRQRRRCEPPLLQRHRDAIVSRGAGVALADRPERQPGQSQRWLAQAQAKQVRWYPRVGGRWSVSIRSAPRRRSRCSRPVGVRRRAQRWVHDAEASMIRSARCVSSLTKRLNASGVMLIGSIPCLTSQSCTGG